MWFYHVETLHATSLQPCGIRHKRRIRIILLAIGQRQTVADAQHLAASSTKNGIGSSRVPFLGLAVTHIHIGTTFGKTGKFQAAATRIDEQIGMLRAEKLINVIVHFVGAVRPADQNRERSRWFRFVIVLPSLTIQKATSPKV